MFKFNLPKRLTRPKTRLDYPQTSQEKGLKQVRSQSELLFALEQARLDRVKEIVIAEDMVLTQTITLDVEGLTLTGQGTNRLQVISPVDPLFDLQANNITIRNLIIAEEYQSGYFDRVFYCGTQVKYCLIENNQIDVEDGYMLDARDFFFKYSILRDNIFYYNADIKGILLDSTISGNIGGLPLNIETTSLSSRNAIIANIINQGTINTSTGLGYNSVIGNVKVATVTTHANDAQAGNS